MSLSSRDALLNEIMFKADQHAEDTGEQHNIGDLEEVIEVLLNMMPILVVEEVPEALAKKGITGWGDDFDEDYRDLMTEKEQSDS